MNDFLRGLRKTNLVKTAEGSTSATETVKTRYHNVGTIRVETWRVVQVEMENEITCVAAMAKTIPGKTNVAKGVGVGVR